MNQQSTPKSQDSWNKKQSAARETRSWYRLQIQQSEWSNCIVDNVNVESTNMFNFLENVLSIECNVSNIFWYGKFEALTWAALQYFCNGPRENSDLQRYFNNERILEQQNLSTLSTGAEETN